MGRAGAWPIAGGARRAPDLSTVIKDADAFVRHAAADFGVAMSDVAVVAHSVGAVVAAAWVHDTRRRSAQWCWRRRRCR